MPAAERTEAAASPLTALSEDEKLFQSTVRRFARERIRPYVREMDEAGVFRKDIIHHFFLTGRKLWITNAAEAGFFLLFANARPEAGYKGVTAFLIEREFPGFQVGKKEDKLGLRASSTCELILDNCRVPRENVLGEPGQGYKVAIETLNEGRIAIGAQMIGLARGALEHATA